MKATGMLNSLAPAPTLEQLDREFCSSGNVGDHEEASVAEDDADSLDEVLNASVNTNVIHEEAKRADDDDADSLDEVLNASVVVIPDSTGRNADIVESQKMEPNKSRADDDNDGTISIPKMSKLSKQLRVLQAKNQTQAIEIERRGRQLRALTEAIGISVTDFRSILNRACAAEAHEELMLRVASLKSQLEALSLASLPTAEDYASDRKIANLELRIGELEEVEEMYSQSMQEETKKILQKKGENGSLQSELQVLQDKCNLLEQQLAAVEEKSRLQKVQLKARIYYQEEIIRDLEQHLSTLQLASEMSHEERGRGREEEMVDESIRGRKTETQETLRVPDEVAMNTEGLPPGGRFFTARISTPYLGVMFFRPHELTSSLFLNTDRELVVSLRDRPVVAFMAENSPAHSDGVRLGDVLLKVNGVDVGSPKVAALLVKASPRPLPLLFYTPDTKVAFAEGQFMVQYSNRWEITADPLHRLTKWKSKYVVIGGINVNSWKMHMYRSRVSFFFVRALKDVNML